MSYGVLRYLTFSRFNETSRGTPPFMARVLTFHTPLDMDGSIKSTLATQRIRPLAKYRWSLTLAESDISAPNFGAEMQSALHSLEMIATYRLPAVQFRTAPLF